MPADLLRLYPHLAGLSQTRPTLTGVTAVEALAANRADWRASGAESERSLAIRELFRRKRRAEPRKHWASEELVPRGRIELPTPRFSDLCRSRSERIRPRFYRRILIRPDQFRTLHSASVAHSRTRSWAESRKGLAPFFVVGTVVLRPVASPV